MKKAILIEDRTERQNQYLSIAGIKIEELTCLKNIIEQEYEDLIDYISKGDTSILDEYDVIILHRSATSSDIIEAHCEKKEKALVLFSGGTTASYYQNGPNEKLSLNSKDLYSKNLRLFLDELKVDNINLRVLAYGEKWELNLVLNILEKINKIKQNDFEDFSEFRDKTKIEMIEYLINIDKFKKNNEITLDVIEKIKKDILCFINSKLGIYYD